MGLTLPASAKPRNSEIEPLGDIDVSARQRVDAGAAALERYAQEFRSGVRLDLVEDIVPHAAGDSRGAYGVGLVLGGLNDLLDRHVLVWTFGRPNPAQRVGVQVADRLKVGVGPASLRPQHRVAPHQVGEHAHRVSVGLRLRGEIGVPDHAGAAGAIVDDDLVAAPLLDMLGKKPCRDVHAAAGGIHHRVFDRASREVFGLELGEFGLRVTALGRGGRGK